MKQLVCQFLIISTLLLCFSFKTLARAEETLEVVEKIPPPEAEIEIVDKIPAPSPSLASTPIQQDGPILVPTISSPFSASDEPKDRDRKSPEELAALAKADLAKRLGIKTEEISTKSIGMKNWSDASLGCPEKGKLYAQVITSGYLIILEVEGKTYNYHTSLYWVVFCPLISSEENISTSLESVLPESEIQANANNKNSDIGQEEVLISNSFFIRELKATLAKIFSLIFH